MQNVPQSFLHSIYLKSKFAWLVSRFIFAVNFRVCFGFNLKETNLEFNKIAHHYGGNVREGQAHRGFQSATICSQAQWRNAAPREKIEVWQQELEKEKNTVIVHYWVLDQQSGNMYSLTWTFMYEIHFMKPCKLASKKIKMYPLKSSTKFFFWKLW